MPGSEIPLASLTSFGDLLKYLRRRARLSQRDLSIAVGYSESQISRLESNLRVPDRTSLLALFVPALQIEDEQEVIDRLLTLAAANRFEHPNETSGSENRIHIPIQLTSFIGRKEDFSVVRQMLRNPEARLVTLTGEGGCGKTRLALQVGANLAGEYEHGVWLVELGSLSDPGLILNATISTLGLHASADRSLLTLLTDFLLQKNLLLILDNCEHLIEAAAQMAESLLKACPKLQIMATSREMLGVSGETIYRVMPLSLPPSLRGVLPSRAQIESYEAIQLFVARARSALHTFELTDSNAPAVAQVCKRLDGIPLALELAAAWVNTLSVEQIAKRLQQDFDLLMDRTRRSLSQHQTLRAAIDWSYNLLTEAERILLHRLSVFAGGLSLEAAEEVASGGFQDRLLITKKQVLSLLAMLVNKSLVLVDQTEERETRYRLLETVREYLREKTGESGEIDWLQNQHLAYFCCLAETAEPELKTSRQVQWMRRLIAEQDNYRAAFRYGIDHGKAGECLRMAGALGHYWWMRGFDNENLRWFEDTLQISSSETSLQRTQPRAKVLFYLGLLLYGDNWEEDRVRRLWEESLSIGQELGEAVIGGAALCFLGALHGNKNNRIESNAAFQEGLQLCKRAEDDWWIAETLH